MADDGVKTRKPAGGSRSFPRNGVTAEPMQGELRGTFDGKRPHGVGTRASSTPGQMGLRVLSAAAAGHGDHRRADQAPGNSSGGRPTVSRRGLGLATRFFAN